MHAHDFYHIQFSSVTQSCPTLCDRMDCCTPGFPVHHQLPEFAQTHVHQVGGAIQPSHLLSSLSPPSFNLSQHQGLFQWVSLYIWWPKYWSFSFSISPSNEYAGLIFFRMNWLDFLAVQGTLKSLLQHHRSKASIHSHSAFFIVHLSHPCMTTGKTIALTIQTFVSKVIFYPNLSQILFGVVTISCVVLMKRTPFHYRSHGGQIFSSDVACISTWQINAFT